MSGSFLTQLQSPDMFQPNMEDDETFPAAENNCSSLTTVEYPIVVKKEDTQDEDILVSKVVTRPRHRVPIKPEQMHQANSKMMLVNKHFVVKKTPGPMTPHAAKSSVSRGSKKRRGLVIDYQMVIPDTTAQIHQADTSEIVASLDMAPPTKTMMRSVEDGAMEKLVKNSVRPLSKRLQQKVYESNLVTKEIHKPSSCDEIWEITESYDE